MRIHFLGTGEAIPTARRQNTSLLLELDEKLILVDCSGSPVHSILRTGCDLNKLTDVVLSHAHVDHVYALPSLLHGLWLRNMKLPQALLRAPGVRSFNVHPQGNRIRLHGLHKTLDVTDRLIDAFELRTRPLSLIIENNYVDPDKREGLDLESREWNIGAFHVSHGSEPAIGLYLDSAVGYRVLFSADAIVDHAIEGHVNPETRILIHDCGSGLTGKSGHAGAEEINRLICTTSIEKVYLTHLQDLNNDELREIVLRVSSGFEGEVIIPEDGDQVTI